VADNVAITAGSGTAIATDEVQVDGNTIGHVQFVKLVDGTLNGTAAIPGALAGLSVVAHRELKRVAVTSAGLTIATTAYTAGDQVGTQLTFANAARVSGGSGTIVGVQLISAADIIGAYDIVFTDSSVTLAADNAAYAISDADALKVVALVQLAGAFDIGNNRLAQAFNLAIPFVCSGSASLFGGLITRAGHTFFAAVGDIQVNLYIEWN
jgi:hypothetical protein